MKARFFLLGAAFLFGTTAPLMAQITYPIDMPAHEVFNKMASGLPGNNLKNGDFFLNFTETSRSEEQGWWTEGVIKDKNYVWSEAHKKQVQRWTIVWAEWLRQYDLYLAELIEYKEDLSQPFNTNKMIIQSTVETAFEASIEIGAGAAGAAVAPWLGLYFALDGLAGVYLEEKKQELSKELKQHITDVRKWRGVMRFELERWALALEHCRAREAGTTYPGNAIPDPSPPPAPAPTKEEKHLEEEVDCSGDKTAKTAQKTHKDLRGWRQHTAELTRDSRGSGGNQLQGAMQHAIDVSAGLVAGAVQEGGCVEKGRR